MTFHESILSQNMDTIETELLYMLTVQAKNLLMDRSKIGTTCAYDVCTTDQLDGVILV